MEQREGRRPRVRRLAGGLYPVIDGIPQLLPPGSADCGDLGYATDRRALYERSRFPDYDDLDSPASLRDEVR